MTPTSMHPAIKRLKAFFRCNLDSRFPSTAANLNRNSSPHFIVIIQQAALSFRSPRSRTHSVCSSGDELMGLDSPVGQLVCDSPRGRAPVSTLDNTCYIPHLHTHTHTHRATVVQADRGLQRGSQRVPSRRKQRRTSGS